MMDLLRRPFDERADRPESASEQMLRLLLDGPLAIAISDVTEGRWQRVNHAFLALTGFDEAHAGGATPAEMNLWLDGAAAARLMRSVRRGTPQRDRYLGFRTRDGVECVAQVSVEPVELGGRPMAMWLLADATARSLAERALHRQNEVLSALTLAQSQWIGHAEQPQHRAPLDAVLDALVRATDSRFGVIARLDAGEEGLCLVSCALTGCARTDDDRAVLARHRRHGLELHDLDNALGRAVGGARILGVRGDGTDLSLGGWPPGAGEPATLFATPLCGPGGAVVGVLALADRAGAYPTWLLEEIGPFFTACGTLLHAQEELRRRRTAEQALRESEERFRLLVDGVEDYALIMLDPYGRVTSWNRGAESITGYGAEEVTGMHISGFYPPESAAEAQRELDRAQVEGRCEVEAERVRRGGARYWASVTLTALCDANGVLRGFAQLTRDVTGKRQLDRMKDEFVSIVSHELRTPLTAIRGALGLLSGGVGGDLDPMTAELVDLARDNSERLVRLINDILDLQKIEAGKMSLRPQPIAPAALVKSTVEQLRALAAENQVELAWSVEDGAAWHADPDRVTQVLTNLISNAVAFSPPGASVTVRVSPAQAAGRSRLSVTDRGPGIPEELRRLLFGKFQQLDGSDARKKGGTGLGLAICKAIVELHGGAIGVDSDVGHGSTFWFELPLSSALCSGRADRHPADP
jgi:PAS domain S-box-containing protein